ncbi:pilus assembly protein [Janthinobacterium aquaticum]|uniref:pilus assembly protein n=1 Tax=Janthinobacterium sp. FT58W TaxID=2654254 RepID=UPI0012650F4D|nr:PilC/PilY family type IV pilus protein [Janthinobacterium sp. FT58W]KAB8037429.1 hypothetical protein GCM43_23795 [Janthinobacterium sp. FT58W]
MILHKIDRRRQFLSLLLAVVAVVMSGGGGQQALAQAQLVDLSRADIGQHGARVPPNLLLDLALTHASAGAAYTGEYLPQQDYSGYFDARLCYRYPLRSQDGVAVPDLRAGTGYFSVVKRAGAGHDCGGDSFSGNFLNWASTSLLDLVRYALSGGDRFIDVAASTVLQRAYLPAGDGGPDFYAHSDYFPRKLLRAGVTAATPFSVTPLAIVSCRNRLLFGDGALAPQGSCDAPGRAGALGVYLARVQVCDAQEGPLRPDLCMAYGKHYKPVGALQRQAGRVRIGVLSPWLAPASASSASGESAEPAYGGPLRAPLAHLGLQRWPAPGFQPQDNPESAWQQSTGVYVKAGSGPAGGAALAYLNNLGRSVPDQPGHYASTAPLAEILYESLRYLQGRQPSAIDIRPRDALPFERAWLDPQQVACQRHTVLALADAGMAADRYVPGNRAVTAGQGADSRARSVDAYSTPPLDVMAWTGLMGLLESGGEGNPGPLPALAALEQQSHGAHGASFYAAGLAYWSHVRAMRPGGSAAGLVPVQYHTADLRPTDNGNSSAMPAVTPLLLAAKYGGFLDDNGDGQPFAVAGANDLHGLNEWSGDGRWPRHYLPGNDPQALIAGLRALLLATDRATLAPTLAGPSLLALASGADDAYWFGSQLQLGDGTMQLARAAMTIGADGVVAPGKALWRAGGNAPSAMRPVHTPDGQGRLLVLDWPRLTAQQRSLFQPEEAGQSGAMAFGEALVRYLQGERTHEAGQPGGFLRRRAGSLGAAPYGNLVYVGAPGLNRAGADYLEHRQRLLGRLKMLYLGANDGLLHAFDAVSGKELFAYLPQALVPGVLAAAVTHDDGRPLLDGAASSAEVLLNGRWATVLLSSMGGGAQGLFALDVTDPLRFAQQGALWEFTDLDDSLMGNLRAPPSVARINMGGKDGARAYRDFAVVGSGYNNTQPDGKTRSAASAAAAIFLLALDKPPGTPWQLNGNYFRLALPVTNDPASAAANPALASHALAPPALVAGDDGALAYLYAGDMQGNVWRLELAGGSPWKDGVGRKLVFVARDAQGARQAITQQIKVAHAPGGGYLLLFGTGKLVEPADMWPPVFAPQSLYAVRDDLKAPSPTRSRADLVARSLAQAEDGWRIGGAELRYAGSETMHGWVLDLAGSAHSDERSVHSPVLAAGMAVFNTVLPGRDACARPATRIYALDVLSGLAADAAGVIRPDAVTGRLLDGLARAPPQLLELQRSASAVSPTGRAEGRRSFAVVQPGAAGATGSTSLRVTSGALPVGRLSWREIANWRELHEASKK